ncbi:MAG: glycosyltransferase [Rhodothermales bacterium]
MKLSIPTQGPSGSQAGPRLSLCMIVKNEAKTLEKCLSLARPHVDEIVVVDTGSTDGTQDIARRYADVYDEIEWPGSFAVARNHSLDLATSEYILILDGDEYIEKPDAWKRIRESLGLLDYAAMLLPVKNLLGDTNVVEADVFWQERILRNHPDIRYFGSVHNQVMEAIAAHAKQTGRQVVRLDAEIVHTGYALPEAEMVKKYKTRLDLLRQEYENPRSDIYRAYYGYQLGLIYFIMRRNEEAAQLFASIDYAKLTPENAYYTRLLGAQTEMRLNRYADALVHCNEMLALNPREPVGFYLTGVALMRAEQIEDGMLMLLQSYHVNEQTDGYVRFVFNTRILLRHLTVACRSIGLEQHARAFESIGMAETFDPEEVKSYILALQSAFARASVPA